MRGARRLAISILAFLALSACASFEDRPGFDDVQSLVGQRLDKRVHWHQGTPEDAAVEQAVRDLLAEGLSPDEAVQVALLNNRRLQANYERLGLAQAALVQAGLLRNPIFSAETTFPLPGGPVDAALAIVQDFLGVLYMPLRKSIARSEFETVKLEVSGAAIDLAAQTKKTFYRLQASQQLVEMRQTVEQATAASLEAVKQLHEAGNVGAVDVYNEQALHERARLELADAQADVIEAREELNRLMGLWGPQTEWEIGPRLPSLHAEELDLAELERRAIEASLDLAALKQDIETSGRRLGLTETSALVPELELGPLAERDEGEWEVGPSIAVPVPLFDQGQAKVAAAKSTLAQRRQEYVALAVEVRAAVRAARYRMLTAREMAALYEDVLLELQSRIVGETQLLYNAMQVGVFQLLVAKRQQIETGGAYIRALRDYWLVRTELEQILSGRLPRQSAEMGRAPMTEAASRPLGVHSE